MSLSGACLAHCVGTAVFVATLASASSILLAPAIHETGLALAILLGAIALGHGALKRGAILPIAIGSLGLGIMAGALSIPHGGNEMIFTMAGVTTLALGPYLNYRAGHGSRQVEYRRVCLKSNEIGRAHGITPGTN